MFRKMMLVVVVAIVGATSYVCAETAKPVAQPATMQPTRLSRPGNPSGPNKERAEAMRSKMRAIQEKKKAMIKANGGKPLTKEQRKQLSDELRAK